jgi:hypothetical protein
LTRANEDIRWAARRSGVYLWQVAEKYHISDANFSRLLRKELPKEKKDFILSIIDDLSRKEATC